MATILGTDGALIVKERLSGIDKDKPAAVVDMLPRIAAPADMVELYDANDNLVGTFATIQSAIDAASTNYSMVVGPGIYSENVIVDVDGLTITGDPGAVLEGTFLSDNNVTGDLNDWLKTAAAYDGSAGVGISIDADNVSIEGLTVRAFLRAVELESGADLTTLTDVNLESNFAGVYKSETAFVTNFKMIGGSIGDGHLGMDITAATTGSSFDVILIDGVSFAELNRKGIYAEVISNAVITNITMNDVGEFGGIPSTGALGAGGNGININAKYGDYANILISDFTFTDVGSSDRDGMDAEGHQNGGAIAIAARDDAPSYSGNPATLSNVTIQDGSIDGTSTGIQIGEPGKDNATPDVTIENVSISDAQHTARHGDIGNQSEGVLTLTGTAAAESYVASGNSDGPIDIDGAGGADTLATGSGADTLAGGADDDTLDGNDGIDVAEVGAGASFTATGSGWTVTSSDGTDTLTDIEIVEDADGNRTLLVNNGGTGGGFTSIQDAVDAANEGDTILIAAGTYDEDVIVDKGVTILGAQDGVSGGDAGRDAAAGAGETNIVGRWKITSATDATIDGLRFVNNSTTTGGGAGNPTLQVQTGGDDAGHTITNTIFWSTVVGGANGVDDRAISTQVIGSGALTITDNLISGSAQGQYSTASWGRGVWFDGGGIALNVEDNVFSWVRSIANLDMTGASTATITGNSFTNSGSGVAVGVDDEGLSILDNTIENLGTDFSFRNLTSDVTFDAGAAVAELIPAEPTFFDIVTVLGGSGDDSLTGTENADYLDGNNHPTLGGTADADSLSGAGGDDYLLGRVGDDAIDGGANDDTLVGGRGADTLAGGDGFDTVDYSAATGNMAINLGTNRASGSDGRDSLSGIEGVLGSDQNDLITGGEDNNRLSGRGGDDVIDARGGDDIVTGGAGFDLFLFGENWGFDRLAGFDENDAEKIDLSGISAIADFDDMVDNHLRTNANNGNAEIFEGANAIQLVGITEAEIGAGMAYDANDFVFQSAIAI